MDTVSVTLCTRRMVRPMSGVAMQSDVGVPETESESTSSSDFNDQNPGKPENRRMTEVNGVCARDNFFGNIHWICN